MNNKHFIEITQKIDGLSYYTSIHFISNNLETSFNIAKRYNPPKFGFENVSTIELYSKSELIPHMKINIIP